MMYPISTNNILSDDLFTTFINVRCFANRLSGSLLEYLRLITGLSQVWPAECWRLLGGGMR